MKRIVFLHQFQAHQTKFALQLKEEEICLLKEQTQKLTRSLDNEQHQKATQATELADLKIVCKQLSEKNDAYIAQLEADNTEIKKRLVKLIK